ncbi:MAG TPA: hypothetical protein ENJ33_08435 [Thiothrix sp.]|nr:hypothetical protein [Thiothrix sp.]
MHNVTAQATLSSFLFICSVVCADSPPSLTQRIAWNDNSNLDVVQDSQYSAEKGVAAVTAAFNHARREEETQLGLPANVIKDLILPKQEVWDTMSDDAKALYLINDARTARADMMPGVLGLALAGVESSFDLMVENYAILLHNTNAKGHYQPSGNPAIDNPLARIQQDPYIGLKTRLNSAKKATKKIACYESLARYENVAFFSGYSLGKADASTVPLPIERSIYNWIYNDAKSGWQYRQTVLLQDNGSIGKGFNNNNGDAQHEGFLGFHRISSANYTPFHVPEGVNGYGVVVVMGLLDPIASNKKGAENCEYSISVRTEDLPVPEKTLIISAN